MFLEYTDYKNLGGVIAEEDVFALYERQAAAKADYYTQGRISALEEIPTAVQEAVARITDLLFHKKDGEIKACSNDGVSITYVDTQGVDAAVLQILREMLPPELMFRGVTR